MSGFVDSMLVWAYKFLAKKGHDEAQFTLGTMYYTGKMVKLDKHEAIRRYRIAADQGYAPAQHRLGVEYWLGKSVQKNDDEAFKWFKLAADQGHIQAKSLIAGCYYYGMGTPKDIVKARQLAEESSVAGDSSCTELLQTMSNDAS